MGERDMRGPSSTSVPDAPLRSGPSAFPSYIKRVRLFITFEGCRDTLTPDR
jgi:hypothetical protein